MSAHDAVLQEFLLDSHASLDRLERCAVNLERAPDDLEELLEAMRLAHSVSGAAAGLGLRRLWGVLSCGEDFLVRLRAGEPAGEGRAAPALSALVEAARQILACIERDGGEGTADYAPLLRRLSAPKRSVMKKKSLLAVVLVLAAAPLRAAEVKPYGFILVNYIQNYGRPNAADVPSQAISDGNAVPPNQTLSLFHARQTRLGLNVSGVKGPADSDVTGNIEMDFWGLRATGAAGNDVLQSAPRLRSAYMQAKIGKHAVVFGQDWVKAFAPLSPASLMHQAVPGMASSGNLWNRLPQLRWDAAWAPSRDGDWGVNTRAALVRAFSSDQAGRTSGAATVATQTDAGGSGEFSGGPAYQALAEVWIKAAGRTFTAGASTQYLRQSFNSLVTPPAGAVNKRVDGLLGSVHFTLPVLERLELSGEGFYGRSDQGVQGLGATYNDLGNVRTSQTRGGWAQAMVKVADGWKVHAAGGFESLDQTGLAAATVYRNETISVNVYWDCSKDMTLSLEAGRIHTYFKDSPAGESKNLGAAAQYRF